MLENLKRNIESWRTFRLSMVGRVNAIKMVTLPRFLYLFQNLPILQLKTFFKALDSIVLPFVWGFRAHRIYKLHVCKPRSMEGLRLPNFQHYYWAANCRALSYWKKSHLHLQMTFHLGSPLNRVLQTTFFLLCHLKKWSTQTLCLVALSKYGTRYGKHLHCHPLHCPSLSLTIMPLSHHLQTPHSQFGLAKEWSL